MASLSNDLIVIKAELLFSSSKNILFFAFVPDSTLMGTVLPVALLMPMHFVVHLTSQCDAKQYITPGFLVLTAMFVDLDFDSSVFLAAASVGLGLDSPELLVL